MKIKFKIPTRLKHNNKIVIRDNIRFASKHEAERYDQLKLLQKAGEVLFFLMQVPFHLPGGVVYKLDFMVFWADQTITFEDPKGLPTAMYKLKKKQVEELYPITITEIYKNPRKNKLRHFTT